MCPSGRSLASNGSKTTSEIPNFRTAFEVLDVDRDGKISRDDLRRFYSGFLSESGGADDDDDVITAMMSVADFNKDGFVEYEEFERVLDGNYNNNNNNNNGKKKKEIKKRSCDGGVMEDVFKVMDKDGDGKLSYEDLKSYMEWAGFQANDDDIKAMIKLGTSGEDDKGSVCFDDLLKILSIDL